jgi:predicted 2-oxoglutarate/Fe(II)-dependent dioxygenase YbiX
LAFSVGDYRRTVKVDAYRKAFIFQMKTHQPGNVRVVFDNKYAWFHKDIVAARSTADPELSDGN